MASSMVSLSRRLARSFLSSPKLSRFAFNFSTSSTSDFDSESEDTGLGLVSEESCHGLESDTPASPSSSPSSSTEPTQPKPIYQRPLESGLDYGIYKAILIGQVGQSPVQKRLKSGRLVTLFSLGTGGIRNNRRPLDNEDPRQYADRCAVQWHRVSVYPERLGGLALKHVKPGSIIYVEGNLETKIFSDPINGLVRRIREVAVRRDGRLLFLNKDVDTERPSDMELKGVGYY